MDIKNNLAENLIKYRKALKLTQSELAERVNYSDKTISKWERGEAIPDLIIMKELADFYGTTIDALIADPNTQIIKIDKIVTKKKIVLSTLSAGLVWLVAICAYVLLHIFLTAPQFPLWLIFIYAIPISSIVLLTHTSKWAKNFLTGLFASLFVWTFIASIFLSFVLNIPDKVPEQFWLIFIIGVPLQLLIMLWVYYKKLKLFQFVAAKKKPTKKD